MSTEAHRAALILVGVTWLFGYRIGWRLCRDVLGIDDREDRIALAAVVPTSGLLLAFHLPALLSLFLEQGIVNPATVAVAFGVVTAFQGYCVFRWNSRVATSPPPPALLDRPDGGGSAWRIPVLIVAGMYAVFLVDAVTRYPSGYDSMYYHLPVALSWMREQAVNAVVGVYYLSHPENGMVVPCLLSFAKAERLIPLVHLPKALQAALAVYGIARMLGASRGACRAASCIVLSIPIVVFQSFSGYIDLYAAAAWLTALLGLMWASRESDRRRQIGLLALAGLSAGVALGSKTTFLLTATFLALVAAVIEWIRLGSGTGGRRHTIANAAIFGAAAMVCSGFWFVRGTVQAGNPVYPLAVKIGQRTILPGFTADDVFPRRSVPLKVSRWWHYPWRETKYSGTGYPYSVNNALGAAFATFVPLGVVASILSLLCRRRAGPSEPSRRWLLISLLLSASGLLLLLTVFREMLRFVLPQVLLSVAVAALLIDRLARRYPGGVYGLLTAALAVTAVVGAFKPAHALAVRVKHGLWGRADYYRTPAMIDSFAPGTRILNLADPMWNYPLAGRQLHNEVIDPGVWRLKLSGGTTTADALRAEGVDYVFSRGGLPGGWSDDLPLELVFDDKGVSSGDSALAARLFRVLPDSGGRAGDIERHARRDPPF